MLFNSDDKFEEDKPEESIFKEFVEQIIAEKLLSAENYDSFEIQSIELDSKRARIYDDESLLKGKLVILLSSKTS